MCRLCHHEHWSYEPHIWPQSVPDSVTKPATKPNPTVTTVTPPVTVTPTVTRKKYASPAEKQAAYRKRKQEKNSPAWS
jgi:hypothetical protein